MDADLLVVLQAGRIAQCGTHAELIRQREGLYYRLHARQFGGVDLYQRPDTESNGTLSRPLRVSA